MTSHSTRFLRTRSGALLGAFTLTAALALSGCGSDEASETKVTNGWDNPDAGKADGAPTITAPTGDAPTELEITDLVEGEGPAVAEGQYAYVDYTGALFDNGKIFDSSYGRSPFLVNVGAGMVIDGWDQGLVGMKVGGKRQLVIPADLAYGSQARDPIPADAPLIFIVELRNILTPPEAIAPIAGGAVSDITITTEIEGTGDTEATTGSKVQMLYVLANGATGEVLESAWTNGRSLEFELGSETSSSPEWDTSLAGARTGERRRIEAPGSAFFKPADGTDVAPPADQIVLIVDILSVS